MIAIAVVTALLELILYGLLVKMLRHKYALPIMLLAPAILGLVLLVVYPMLYEITLAFSNMSLDNFKKSYMLTDQTVQKLEEANVPAELLTGLKGFSDHEYASQEQFLQGVAQIIGQDQMKQYQDLFLQSVQKLQRVTMTEDTLQALQGQNISEDMLAKLRRMLNQTYPSELDLVSDLQKILGQDLTTQYRPTILAASQKTEVLKFTRLSFSRLSKDVPAEVVSKLKEQKGLLNIPYSSDKDFLEALTNSLGVESVTQYRSAFLTLALANPGPTFGIAQALKNFREIFTRPVLKQVNFFRVFWRTILWTIIQVPSHVIFGLGLAMLLNRPMKLRGLYRTLIIIPWAIPQIIAVMAWRGEFHAEYGSLNLILKSLSLPGLDWKSNPFWNFVAINMTNIWLGVPFMMVILLGGLQSISQTYYEAAEVDGATGWHKFWNITLPLIQPVMTPAVILGVIWTFNNFNVPYLLNDNELETSDILVTALFRSAFEYNRYGFAAAFALVIFLILLVFCLIYMRVVQLDLGLASEKKKKG